VIYFFMGNYPPGENPGNHRFLIRRNNHMNQKNTPMHPGAMTPAQHTRHIIRRLYTTAGAVATATAITATLIYLLFL
jgi:hypothetical protein